MIDALRKLSRSPLNRYEFCLLIPTWNNIAYLKNCINSILKNSFFKNQIVVIINEGTDGTLHWVGEQTEIDYVYAPTNIGICYGLNAARSLIKSDYIVYVNDDMYVLPNWDKVIYDEIQNLGTKAFMLSATMIEPQHTNNPCVIVRDYGSDIDRFDESSLLKEYQDLAIEDWCGSMWPPNVVHVEMWDLVGGMSIEYSPGMYSDPDLTRKLFDAGVRIFKGKGASLVYHFGSKSTRRLRKSNGKKIFLAKWGITPGTFTKHYLQLGSKAADEIGEPQLNRKTLVLNKLKRLLNSWKHPFV